MSFVLDASVAGSWCLQDEADPAIDALLAKTRKEGACAPPLWRWEVANLLLSAVRRGRMSEANAIGHFGDLALLPIAIDADAPGRAWRETFALADAHALTVYDAAYLELAMRTGLSLATKDDDLRKAAQQVGVALLP